jgi:hypothetical protein
VSDSSIASSQTGVLLAVALLDLVFSMTELLMLICFPSALEVLIIADFSVLGAAAVVTFYLLGSGVCMMICCIFWFSMESLDDSVISSSLDSLYLG